MILLLIAMLLLLLSGTLAPLGHRRSGPLAWLAALCGLGGAGLGLLATAFCLFHPQSAILDVNWPTIAGRFFLKVDPLSAVFLFPLFLITGTGQLYGLGYRHPDRGWIDFFYPLLAFGMVLLLTAGNGVLFLIGWEIMALAGYFLVVTERGDEEVQRAGFIYLAATHAGTLALFGMFALLGSSACLVSLPAAASLAPAGATLVFLLALFGFGFKAGLMPLHIWLPRAHAAAPSQVSALMSGVMIKTGVYGLFRVLSFFHDIPPWWGWTILGLGLLSGVMGVVLAIAQHDLKRLLAYHSVENIGIILIGLGGGLLGLSHGLAGLAVLGLAGGLLHVVNHGLFKALLFLSGGAVIRATHSREMSDYGGLLRSMPLSGFFFLGGAVAICGLPPLNGFVSEWLIYLGLLRGGVDQAGLIGVLPAVAGLALIGGLALLCFTKVFGLCFLGEPRPEQRDLREAPGSMLLAMALLLAACLGIGLVPLGVLPLLARAVSVPGPPEVTGLVLAGLAPAGYLSLGALLLLFCIALPAWSVRRRKKAVRRTTWGCGYVNPLPRARYTPSSFAETIMLLFRWSLRTRETGRKPAGLFPATSSFATRTPDFVLDLLVLPVANRLAAAAGRFRQLVQHGVLGFYFLYSALILCLLLVFAVFRH